MLRNRASYKSSKLLAKVKRNASCELAKLRKEADRKVTSAKKRDFR